MARLGGSETNKNVHNCGKRKSEIAKGLILVLREKFRPYHHRMVSSLNNGNLQRKRNESAQEWIGRLWMKAPECDFKEYNRLQGEQFIYGLDSDGMISKILGEVSTLEDIDDGMSERVLLWAHKSRSAEDAE